MFDVSHAQVNSSLDWFHPAEVGILNQLLQLGSCVWAVEAFVRSHRHSGMPRQGSRETDAALLPPGLYLEALCDGLESALRPYKLTLAAMEKDILRTGM